MIAILGKALAATAAKFAAALFSEKVITAIVVKLGDYLVKSTKNPLDNQVWAEVKKALK